MTVERRQFTVVRSEQPEVQVRLGHLRRLVAECDEAGLSDAAVVLLDCSGGKSILNAVESTANKGEWQIMTLLMVSEES